jgi:hypothetical protein
VMQSQQVRVDALHRPEAPRYARPAQD